MSRSSTNTWRASVFHGWENAGMSRFYMAYRRDDYRIGFDDVQDGDGDGTCPAPGSVCGPPGLNESTARNRDGWEILTGFEQSLALPELEWLEAPGLSLGYEFNWVEARGREWGNQGHSVWIGPSVTLPFELTLAAEARFTYRGYAHPTTYPDSLPPSGEYTLRGTDRRETEWNLLASIERKITENISISAIWRYGDTDSTAKTFTYRRHVVGLEITGRLGPR